MAHAVSLSYARSDHMSPTAMVLAAVLHGAVALALWWVSPLSRIDRTDDPVEITMEQDPAPPTPPAAAPEPPPVQEAAVTPPPPPLPPAASTPVQPPPRLGLQSAPIGVTLDPKAQLGAQPSDPTTTATKEPNSAGPATPKAETQAKVEAEKPEPTKPEPTQPDPPKADTPRPEIVKPEDSKPQTAAVQREPTKPEPETKAEPEHKPEPEKTVEPENKPEPAKEQQQAALALPPTPPLPPAPPLPPVPPAPTLENALPPLEAPPPPVTAAEVPRPAPPPPPPPPPAPPKPAPQVPPPAVAAKPTQPPQQAQQAPPPRPQLFSSPLSNLPQHPPSSSQQQASRSTSPTFVNPSQAYGERKAQEDYLWAVVRKISQYRYYPKNARDNSEEGTVEARLSIGRDGRLLDVNVAKSSGYPTLDAAMIDIIRQASPYPPLPADIRGDRHVFNLPLHYRRNDPH